MNTESTTPHWGQVLADRWLALRGHSASSQPQWHAWVQQLACDIDAGHTCFEMPEWPEGDLMLVPAANAAQPEPIVHDQGFLYLWRHWSQEQQLAADLVRIGQAALPAQHQNQASGAMAPPPAHLGLLNEQQQQALTQAMAQPLTLITGGPGTGKTHTLAWIVKALVAQQPHLRIALAAPTGKAAQRMEQAMHAALSQAASSPAHLHKAQTIHRLLGIGEDGRVQHDRHAPLPYDLVVIDEASMLDLQLAAQLFDALATGTRVILLGDAHQLAAVDAGAVLHDLGQVNGLATCRVQLKDSKRFDPSKGIGKLAQLVLGGDSRHSMAALDALLHEEAALAAPQVRHHPLAGQSPALVQEALWSGYAAYVAAVQSGQDMATQFAAFDRYRILVAQHSGPYGTHMLNQVLAQKMRDALGQDTPQPHEWFVGRPVMMTRNDYALGLSNGDIGICAQVDGEWVVHFVHLDEPVSVHRLPASQLETAFVLTIHKSQGSEFERVAMLLDPSGNRRLVSRELVYTALTRARTQVDLWCELTTLRSAIGQPTWRTTGLQAQVAQAFARQQP